MKNSFLLILVASFFSFPVYAIQGTDTSPGDSCGVEDAVRMTANPSGTGGYILTCEGGVWVATLSGELPTEDEQVATKEYVDLNGGISVQNPEDCNTGDLPVYAADTGDWWCGAAPSGRGCIPDPTCPNVGDVCSGTGSGGGNPKFAGCMCYYDANGADAGICKALYVTQANQSTSSMWKIATGTDDITTDSMEDGIINDGQVANSTDFPAFKPCKDLSDGGYTDWYLPARRELDLLWLNKDAITGFSASYYWSSSEFSTTSAWSQNFNTGGHVNTSSKNYGRYVRCVRRD